MRAMTRLLLGLVTVAVLSGQVKPGDPAPALVAPPLDASKPFAGWAAYRGDFVVVDFWATWCGPCLPGLDKFIALEKEFEGRGVSFLTVALDTSDRVRQYYREKGIAVATFVEGDQSPTAESFGVRSVPGAALIDREGRIVGVTSGENITAEVLRKALAGEAVRLPPFERPNNIFWDRDEITWQDGVLPEFAVLIKPMAVSGGGYAYKPGSNHISGDGASVQAMIQAAWRTNAMHLDLRAKLPEGTYRFAVTVPQAKEAELLPTLQDALRRSFGIQTRWEDQDRDVFVLGHDPVKAIQESHSAPLSQFMRGVITLRSQSAEKLADMLPNWVGKPVLDETGLSGSYDFDLQYRDDGPKVLTDSLAKYGLSLMRARRPVRTLVVERNP
jgi:uncharacterized protein (TIGR03435 family)